MSKTALLIAPHALDEIGGTIWEMIEQPVRIKDLCMSLSNLFDVTTEDCKRDVLVYLKQLQERDLLKTFSKELNEE
ncbi:MAG: PqqD family protein [Candidatus Electrothrix sp. AW3_4]|nr:PqqD family protein [Candidatus Electrothrix gigas]